MRASAVLAALWIARSSPAHADCTPSADLSGDADVAAEVARALARLGVVFAEADGACPAVRATVTADPAGVAVTVRDDRGRIEGRVVADAHTAAAWIESWASDDAAPLWAATPEVPPPAPAPVEVAIVTPPSTVARDEVRVIAPRTSTRWRVPAIAVRVGRDLASDGSAWDGAGAGACLGLGKLCVGVSGRYARDAGFSNTGGLTAYDRTATSMSATIAVRAAVARVVIAPELAIGVGATTTRRHEPDASCVDASGMALCPDQPLYIGDGFEARTYAPRIAAALGVQVPLTGWLALDARVGAEAVPGAHTSPHVADAQVMPPDPTAPVVPGDPLLDLPGEPGWAWTAAIGLRVEAP